MKLFHLSSYTVDQILGTQTSSQTPDFFTNISQTFKWDLIQPPLVSSPFKTPFPLFIPLINVFKALYFSALSEMRGLYHANLVYPPPSHNIRLFNSLNRGISPVTPRPAHPLSLPRHHLPLCPPHIPLPLSVPHPFYLTCPLSRCFLLYPPSFPGERVRLRGISMGLKSWLTSIDQHAALHPR